MVMAVSLITVDGQKWEQADQLQTLAEHIGQGYVVGPLIVGIQRQNAPGKGIHHIAAGRLHDNIPHKAGGQRTVAGEQGTELFELGSVGKLVEQKKIGDFLKAEAVSPGEAVHQILYVIPAVKEASMLRHLHTVHDFLGAHIRHIGQACQDALAV